jgi:hypothetical protein
LLDARGGLRLLVLDVPHCNGFRFFRPCGLNVHRLLVLRHLFHLHFFLHHVPDDRNRPDDHCALVYQHLNVQDGQVLQNLNEQDGPDEKHLHVQDDPDEQHLHVQDDRVSPKQGALDELLFQDVPILMNPNERGARCENDLVLD